MRPEFEQLPQDFYTVDAPGTPVQPKDAATVVLLREGAEGIEAFLQRRVTSMAFAGGMTVFPGGGVDDRDTSRDVPWAGPPAAQWAKWFGCDERLATALVCAAVRETFEESGVLLAGPSEGEIVADTKPFAQVRSALVARDASLAEFLADAGLVLRADLLRPLSSWVTPENEPRRYDARFFLAALPEGQQADGATTEAASAEWCRPAGALAEVRAGTRMMLPPTMVTLGEFERFDRVADAFAAEREISRFAPSIVQDGDGIRVDLS